VRRLLDAAGLPGARWHVGHAEPNAPGSARSGRGAGPEDLGWNLLAQARAARSFDHIITRTDARTAHGQ
jgi:hypothetical protein